MKRANNIYTITGFIPDAQRAGLNAATCDRCGSGLIRKAIRVTRDDGMDALLGPDCAGSAGVRTLTHRQARALQGAARAAYYRALVAMWTPRAEAAWDVAGRPEDCAWALDFYSQRPWDLVALLKARGHLPADWAPWVPEGV